MKVCQDFSIIHQNDPVHIFPENILQTVFNDQNSGVSFLLDLIDQFDGLFACSRIKVCQRFVKKQDLYLVYHDSGQADALFLSTG